jgi:hypothetical protein
VTGAKIATGAVGSSDIEDDSLIQSNLGSSSVGPDEIADFSVGTPELKNVTAVVGSGVTVNAM